jgi:bifunctional DNA-binding transcriptional regulator/antitoxin component of YhaV-PrlF toxin-antitoxin module
MPRTAFLKIYQSKGNSDTMAVVVPRELRKTLKLRRGDKLQVKVDDKNGLLIYNKT